MKFMKFTSLDNVVSQSTVHRVEGSGLTHPSVQWMVTEKIHGANFAMYSDGENFEFASRTAILCKDINFFDGQRVAEEHREKVLSLAKGFLDHLRGKIKLDTGDELVGVPYIILYGELFGGSVQKNMPYPDKQNFAVFDFVTVLDIENKDVLSKVFDLGDLGGTVQIEDKIVLAPSNKLYSLGGLRNLGFMTAPILRVGTFEECMALSNDFTSTLTDVAKVNNLKLSPEFRELRCKSEGLVIEPVVGTFNKQARVYLKSRSPKFETKKYEPKKNVNQMHLDNMSAKALFVLNGVEERICEDRFDSVVSKIGEVTMRDFNKIAGLMLQDAMEDFEKDEFYDVDTDTFGTIKGYLDKAEVKAVTKIAYFTVTNLIRPLLLKK